MATVAQIEGLDALFAKLERMGDPAAYKKAIEKSCRIVERQAKQNCTGLFDNPTGVLKASITHEVEQTGNAFVGYVGTPLEYAPYQEFGTGLFAENGDGRKDVPWRYKNERTGEWVTTSGNKPKPYLRPALAASRGEIKQILIDTIRKGELNA